MTGLLTETLEHLGRSKRNPFRELFPQTETVRPGAATSSTQAAGVYLPLSAPGLGSRGVLVGKDLSSGNSFIYDPFELYGEDLPAGHVLVNGMSGRGKSAFVKTFMLRALTFSDRQAVVLDAQGDGGQGEWSDIAAALGVTPIRVTPGVTGGVRINPLDPAIALPRQKALLRTLVLIGLDRPFAVGEQFALDHALDRARDLADGEVLVLSDVLDALTEPVAGQLGQREITASTLLGWGEPLALQLHSLIEGPMKHAFDGPTTDSIDLTGRLVIFDLSSLDRNTIAVPLLMAVMGEWLRYTWIKPDGVKRYLVCEEAWDVIRHGPVAELFRELLKYGRRLGLSVWFVMHHPGDVAHSSAAQEILKMTDTRIIYGLRQKEAEQVGKVLQLPPWAVATVSSPQMRRGYAIWAVGRRTMFVQHVRSAAEIDMSNTDKGMASNPHEFRASGAELSGTEGSAAW